MNDNEREIELSAYADGEVDAVRAQAAAGRLAEDAALRRAVTCYARLDKAAAQLPAPELSGTASVQVWRTVAQRTTEVTAADRRAWARLEQAAAALPAPAVGAEAWERVWAEVRPEAASLNAAVREAEVPAVSAERWDKVWGGIRARTVDGADLKPQVSSLKPRVVSLRWRWLAVASLAAAVLFGLLVYMPHSGEGPQAALEVPEVLDQSYRVQVKYVEGQASPVVCFYLKDDTGLGDRKPENWRWLPE